MVFIKFNSIAHVKILLLNGEGGVKENFVEAFLQKVYAVVLNIFGIGKTLWQTFGDPYLYVRYTFAIDAVIKPDTDAPNGTTLCNRMITRNKDGSVGSSA